MALLEAALAFATLMIVLATIVSIIMETIHRVLGLRESGLQLVLDRMFDEVIVPRLETQLRRVAVKKGWGGDLTKLKAQFKEDLSKNHIGPVHGRWIPNWIKKKGRFLKTLSTEEFIERLGGTEVGHALVNQAKTTITSNVKDFRTTLVKDIAGKFAEYGKSASASFEARARFYSILVSIALAFALNINAYTIFQTFLYDENARGRLINSSDQIVEDFKQQEARLAQLQQQIENNDGLPGDAEEQFRQLTESSENLKGSLDNLGQIQLPIGWKDDPFGKAPEILDYVAWFFLVLLSGLLIGLGGPFWFEIVSSLRVVTGLLRGLGFGAKKQAEKTTTSAAASDEKEQPTTPTQIFEVAVASQSARVTGRALLQPNGSIDMGD